MTIIEYDASSNIIKEKKNDITTGYIYDAIGNRTCIHHNDGSKTRYVYKANLPVEVMYNNASVAMYTYDNLGRKIKDVYGNGVITEYTYDNDKLLSIANGDQVFEYAHDKSGNIINKGAIGSGKPTFMRKGFVTPFFLTPSLLGFPLRISIINQEI